MSISKQVSGVPVAVAHAQQFHLQQLEHVQPLQLEAARAFPRIRPAAVQEAVQEEAKDESSEELLSSLTHGLGLALSIVGFIGLFAAAQLRPRPGFLLSCMIYGGTLVFTYAASVLYHSFKAPLLKHLLRIVDHIAIFLLIAGTATPFLLVSLGDGWGMTLLYSVWAAAFAGVGYKIFSEDRFGRLSTCLYVAMGWMIILAAKPLLGAVAFEGVMWLLAGGLFYTGGVVFFVWNELPYNHAVWHFFVMGGSLCHYVAVFFYA